MRLFKYEGYNLTISEEAFALKVFRQIWNRDRSQSKEKAIMELGFIYFMEDVRSDYQFIIDPEERAKSIKEGEGLKESWVPDALVKEGMKLYASFKTTSALLLEDTRALINNYRLKLRSLDFDELDVKSTKVLGDIIQSIPKMVKDLDEAERALAKEMAQDEKVRGVQEKAMFEDL